MDVQKLYIEELERYGEPDTAHCYHDLIDVPFV
jgi:hypothetical protein